MTRNNWPRAVVLGGALVLLGAAAADVPADIRYPVAAIALLIIAIVAFGWRFQ